MMQRILVIAKDGPLTVLASWLNFGDFDVTICSNLATARGILSSSALFPFAAIVVGPGNDSAAIRLILAALSHLPGLVCVTVTNAQFSLLPSSGRLRRLEPTDDVASATAKIERWLLELE